MKLSKLLCCLAVSLLVTGCAGKKKPSSVPVVIDSTPQKTTQTTPQPKAAAKLQKVDYEGFTLWMDCKERAAVKFRYKTRPDTGSEVRKENFTLDPNLPRDCQQTSTKGYGRNYDRGHQVPANHMDYSENAIKQSNYMTNILPQAAGMNRGAWLLTEEIVECYRDIDELLVLGGVIWGNNTADDYFVASHGVRTPNAFWKVIIRANNDVIAWIVPNSPDAKREKLDDYLVTVAKIEQKTGEKLPVSGAARTQKPRYSWMLPVGCNKN